MDEPKTKEDIKNMLKHLDDEYRKANISEKTYKELKEKYKAQMSYMDNTINPDETKPQETVPEEKKPGGGSMFGKLFHKREQPQETAATTNAPEPAPVAEVAAEPAAPEAQEDTETAKPGADVSKALAATTQLSIDLEKLKVIIDAMHDQKKATDESVQSLFEGIGEIRSMSIQNDATARDISSKLERFEDDVTNLRPKELEKKFNQINETLEKYQLNMEKIQAKTDDMSERLNKVYETIRLIGNTENLSNINQNVQKKLDDIREATNYVERLASKAEKIFLDLKIDLEEMVVYRSRQEAIEDSVREILKSLDAMGIRFENYSTKKEMEEEKQDIMILSKEQESIKGAMAIVQTNVPESILNLRKDREDIKLFLDSIEDQVKGGKIKMTDYDTIKKKNIEKLNSINELLLQEWKKYEMISKIPKEELDAVKPEETKAEKLAEDAKEEVKDGVKGSDQAMLVKKPSQEVVKVETAEAEEGSKGNVQVPVSKEESTGAVTLKKEEHSTEKKSFLERISGKREKEAEILPDAAKDNAQAAKEEEPVEAIATTKEYVKEGVKEEVNGDAEPSAVKEETPTDTTKETPAAVKEEHSTEKKKLKKIISSLPF